MKEYVKKFNDFLNENKLNEGVSLSIPVNFNSLDGTEMKNLLNPILQKVIKNKDYTAYVDGFKSLSSQHLTIRLYIGMENGDSFAHATKYRSINFNKPDNSGWRLDEIRDINFSKLSIWEDITKKIESKLNKEIKNGLHGADIKFGDRKSMTSKFIKQGSEGLIDIKYPYKDDRDLTSVYPEIDAKFLKEILNIFMKDTTSDTKIDINPEEIVNELKQKYETENRLYDIYVDHNPKRKSISVNWDMTFRRDTMESFYSRNKSKINSLNSDMQKIYNDYKDKFKDSNINLVDGKNLDDEYSEYEQAFNGGVNFTY